MKTEFRNPIFLVQAIGGVILFSVLTFGSPTIFTLAIVEKYIFFEKRFREYDDEDEYVLIELFPHTFRMSVPEKITGLDDLIYHKEPVQRQRYNEAEIARGGQWWKRK